MQFQTISKALLAAAAGSLFVLGAPSAFAADTADLTVKGTIVPAACSANFTGGDTVDFGTIPVVDLLPNSYNLLGTKDTALNVNCSTDKRVTFTIADAQSASRVTSRGMLDVLGASMDYLYGIGTGTVGGAQVNLGAYTIAVEVPKIDGVNRTYMYSNNNGSTWHASPGLVGKEMITAGNGTTPANGKVFDFGLKIKAALNKGSELQVASDTPLNGQAVFTINYQ